jgi:hypothetical protein
MRFGFVVRYRITPFWRIRGELWPALANFSSPVEIVKIPSQQVTKSPLSFPSHRIEFT